MAEDVVSSVKLQLKDGVVPDSNIFKHVKVLIGGILRELAHFRWLPVPGGQGNRVWEAAR
jgi:hypothetical protein